MFIRTREEKDEQKRCKICDLILEHKDYLHFLSEHKIKIADYYDKYFKRPYEGICLECGRQTTLREYNLGYRLFCDRRCLLIYYKKRDMLAKFKQNRINKLMENEVSNFDLIDEKIHKKYYDIYHKERNKDYNICIYTQCSNITEFIDFKSGYKISCTDCNYLVFYGHDLENPYDVSKI